MYLLYELVGWNLFYPTKYDKESHSYVTSASITSLRISCHILFYTFVSAVGKFMHLCIIPLLKVIAYKISANLYKKKLHQVSKNPCHKLNKYCCIGGLILFIIWKQRRSGSDSWTTQKSTNLLWQIFVGCGNSQPIITTACKTLRSQEYNCKEVALT